MKRDNKGYLPMGVEVVTDELRVAVVDAYHTETRIAIRYHNPLWPFPEWDIKTRCQLTPVPIQYEDALM